MSSTQRIIKYLAISFAFLLVFSILSAIMFGISILTDGFDRDEINGIKLDKIDILEEVSSLDIDINTSKVLIKKSNTFKVETNNKDIDIYQDDKTLIIRENKINLFNLNNDNELTIYLPVDLVFNDVDINTGAGKISIDKLETRSLYLNLGAGDATINNINVTNTTTIDSGVGKLAINNGILNNLELDLGVGSSTINAKILGNSEISSGIGSTTLNLIGSRYDYRIEITKGLGDAKIDGSNVSDGTIYGNGTNTIDIDGGIGSIKVNFNS